MVLDTAKASAVIMFYTKLYGRIVQYEPHHKKYMVFAGSRDLMRLTPIVSVTSLESLALWCLKMIRKDRARTTKSVEDKKEGRRKKKAKEIRQVKRRRITRERKSKRK